MKDIIILKKTRERKKMLEDIADTTMPAEVAQVLSSINLAKRFKWAMGNADLNIIKDQRLTNIKKYQRHIG